MHIDIERLAEREEMRELLWIGHIATLFVHNQMRLKAET